MHSFMHAVVDTIHSHVSGGLDTCLIELIFIGIPDKLSYKSSTFWLAPFSFVVLNYYFATLLFFIVFYLS